jgi:hypothetical protein
MIGEIKNFQPRFKHRWFMPRFQHRWFLPRIWEIPGLDSGLTSVVWRGFTTLSGFSPIFSS